MVDDLAVGVLTASPRARIHAFLVDASLVRGTLRADDAFRPTARRRSHVLWQTRAYGLAVVDFALTVGTAG